MEYFEDAEESFPRIGRKRSSYCLTCFNVPQVSVYHTDPPRLEELALHAVANLIDKYRNCVIEADSEQLEYFSLDFCDADPFKYIVMNTLYKSANKNLNWKMMEKILKTHLNYLELICNTCKKMQDEKMAECNLASSVVQQVIDSSCQNEQLQNDLTLSPEVVSSTTVNMMMQVIHRFINLQDRMNSLNMDLKKPENYWCFLPIIENNSARITLLQVKSSDVNEQNQNYTADECAFLESIQPGSSVKKMQELIVEMPRLFAICKLICEHTECHDLFLEDPTELCQNIVKLQLVPESLGVIHRAELFIREFLNTGPHPSLEEDKCEGMDALVHQVPRAFANQITELLGWPLHCETSKKKRLLEAMVHPAVTRIQDPCTSSEVRRHVFFKILPTLKNLQQVTISIAIILCDDKRYLSKLEEEILTSLERNCDQLKDLRLHIVPAMEPYVDTHELSELSHKLTQLPSSLRAFKWHGSSDAFKVEDLNAMAHSQRFTLLHYLSLSCMDCNTPLEQGFQSLTVLKLKKFFFESRLFLNNIGHQLREITLHFVYMLNLQELARACPLLQILTVKNCSVFYNVQDAKPQFKSLREFHFIFNYFHSTFDGMCIFSTLKHSKQLRKLEIFTKDVNFSVCLKNLLENNCINELNEIEIYKCDSNEARGLLSREMVDQLLKQCHYVYTVGGIESLETRNALSKLYPKITFLCISQKLRNYCSAERLKFNEDSAVFLDFEDHYDENFEELNMRL